MHQYLHGLRHASFTDRRMHGGAVASFNTSNTIKRTTLYSSCRLLRENDGQNEQCSFELDTYIPTHPPHALFATGVLYYHPQINTTCYTPC